MAATNPEIKLDPKYDNYDYPTTAPTAQSGHPGHTTPEQDAQVYQLRMKLEQDGYTERLDTLTLVSSWTLLLPADTDRLAAAIPKSPQVRRQLNVPDVCYHSHDIMPYVNTILTCI
jgi:hypothetical protein